MTLPKPGQNSKRGPAKPTWGRCCQGKRRTRPPEVLQCMWAWIIFQKCIRTPQRGETCDGEWPFHWVHHVEKVGGCSLVCGLCGARRCSLLLTTLTLFPGLIFFSSFLWAGKRGSLQPHASVPRCQSPSCQVLLLCPSSLCRRGSAGMLRTPCGIQITLRCWRSAGAHQRYHSTRNVQGKRGG